MQIYNLQIYYQSGFDTTIKNIDTPDNITSFTITGLMPSTNYTVYLSAFTGAGEGNFSAVIITMTMFEGKHTMYNKFIHSSILSLLSVEKTKSAYFVYVNW